MNNLVVEPFVIRDLEKVVELLLVTLYKNRPSVTFEKLCNFYKWKYFEHRGDFSQPTGYVAKEQQMKVIGFIGCPAFNLITSTGEKIHSAWITDWFIHPFFTGKGIGSKLLMTAQQYLPALCGTQFTVQAIHLIERNNFTKYAEFKNVTLVTSPRDYFLRMRKGVKKLISWYEFFHYKFKFSSIQMGSNSPFKSISLQDYVRAYTKFNYLGLERSEAYIKWMAGCSFFSLSFFEYTGRGENGGVFFIFLKAFDIHGRRVGKIVDVTPLGGLFGDFYKNLLKSKLMKEVDYLVFTLKKAEHNSLSLDLPFYKCYDSSFWCSLSITLFHSDLLHHHLIDKDETTRSIEFIP